MAGALPLLMAGYAYGKTYQTVNLSTPMKSHNIYDLTISLPTHWQVSKNLSDDPSVKEGAVRAVDYSKNLNYPRNIEIKVMSESISANHFYSQKISHVLKRKFMASYRSLTNYETVHTDIVDVAGRKAIMLISHFRYDGSDMAHVHLAIPNSGHYFLVTYSDLRSLLSHNSDQSFELFWNIAEQISLPSHHFLAGVMNDGSAFAVMVVASLLLLILFGVIVMLLKNISTIQVASPEVDIDEASQHSIGPSVPVDSPLIKPPVAVAHDKAVSLRTKLGFGDTKDVTKKVAIPVTKTSTATDDGEYLDFKEFAITQDIEAYEEDAAELDGTLIDKLDVHNRTTDDKDRFAS